MSTHTWPILAAALCMACAASCQPQATTQDDGPVRVLWQRQFGSTDSEMATDVSLDSEGNCYVTGRARGELGQSEQGEIDIFIAKYAGNGSLSWIRQFGTNETDWPSGIAVDAEGNSFVVGSINDVVRSARSIFEEDEAEESDEVRLPCILLAKYNADGQELWTRQFGDSGRDGATGIAVDAEGNCYISGTTRGDLAAVNRGGIDIFIAKYDGDGTRLWVRQFGTDGRDLSSDIGVDDAGNVYVSGWTEGDMGGPNRGRQDALVLRCDSEGELLTAIQFGTPEKDIALAIAVGAEGDFVVAGETKGDLVGSVGSADIFVASYDRKGNRRWITQAGEASSDTWPGFMYATNLAVDDNGDIYITGYVQSSELSEGRGSLDALVMKFSSAGQEQWRRDFVTTRMERATGVAVSSDGTCYVVGETRGSLAGDNYGFDPERESLGTRYPGEPDPVIHGKLDAFIIALTSRDDNDGDECDDNPDGAEREDPPAGDDPPPSGPPQPETEPQSK